MCISLTSEIKASSCIIITAEKGENSFIFELEVVLVVLGGSCEGGGMKGFQFPSPPFAATPPTPQAMFGQGRCRTDRDSGGATC